MPYVKFKTEITKLVKHIHKTGLYNILANFQDCASNLKKDDDVANKIKDRLDELWKELTENQKSKAPKFAECLYRCYLTEEVQEALKIYEDMESLCTSCAKPVDSVEHKLVCEF